MFINESCGLKFGSSGPDLSFGSGHSVVSLVKTHKLWSEIV